MKEIIRKKEYSFFEEKVNLLDKKQMSFIEERDPMVVPFKDFKVEDWGDGLRKIADIQWRFCKRLDPFCDYKNQKL